jgi:hypothetical protein
MNVYLIVKKDETGKVFEIRVPQDQLADNIRDTFALTTMQILSVTRL